MTNPPFTEITHPWYDPEFVHPEHQLLRSFMDTRKPPDYYWPIEAERAYGKALIGVDYYDAGSHSQLVYLLQAEDAFTFNAVLYGLFVICDWPDELFPVLCNYALQYQEANAAARAARAGDNYDWPALRHAKGLQTDITHQAWDAIQKAWRSRKTEVRQLSMFEDTDT